MAEPGVFAENALVDLTEIAAGAFQIDRQVADPEVKHQAGHSSHALVVRAEPHLPGQRNHQRADRQGMAIDVFQVALAPHQAVEGMRVALHRGEDVLDHRFDGFGIDCLAQPRFEKDARHRLLRTPGNAGRMAEFARGGLGLG